MIALAPDISAPSVFFSALRASFEDASADGTICQQFEIGGLPVDIVCPVVMGADELDHYLSGLAARPGTKSDRQKKLTLMFSDVASTGIDLPQVDWKTSDWFVRGQVPRLCDSRFAMSYNIDSQLLAAFDATVGLGIQVIRDFSQLPQYEWGAPFRELLSWALSAKDRMLVHASAVAAQSGAALLVGPGGSGKSTTAALCAASVDLDFLADDYCAIVQDCGDPQVHSIFRTAKLTQQWEHMSFDPATAEFSPETGKTLYRLTSDQVANAAPIKFIYLPKIREGQSSVLSPVGPGAAMRRIAPSTLLQLPGTGQHEMGMLARLVRNVPAFELSLGQDREQLVQLIANHLNGSN